MMRSRLSAAKRGRRVKARSLSESAINSRKHRPDYVILVLMSALLVCGAVVVYAIGPGLTTGTNLGDNYYSSKQTTAILLGLLGFGIAAFIPLEKWKKYQLHIIIAAVAAALLVRFIGEEINGAHRWIQVGGF